VHETLSRTLADEVDFDEVADRIAALVGDTGDAGRPVRVVRHGRFGPLPAEIATPLSLVLVELLQNGAEHGVGPDGGQVAIAVTRDPQSLSLTVADDGPGLPAGFDATRPAGLGLQIVRTLVTSELGGTLGLGPGSGGHGCEAAVSVPLGRS